MCVRIFIWLQAKCLQLDSNLMANNLRNKMGWRHFFQITHFFFFFLLFIGLYLERHLRHIEMLNDSRVASLELFKDNVCTTRINKEKRIKFKALLQFAQFLSDFIQLLFVLENTSRGSLIILTLAHSLN